MINNNFKSCNKNLYCEITLNIKMDKIILILIRIYDGHYHDFNIL